MISFSFESFTISTFTVQSARLCLLRFLAGAEGFEPPRPVLETGSLPLNLRPCKSSGGLPVTSDKWMPGTLVTIRTSCVASATRRDTMHRTAPSPPLQLPLPSLPLLSPSLRLSATPAHKRAPLPPLVVCVPTVNVLVTMRISVGRNILIYAQAIPVSV